MSERRKNGKHCWGSSRAISGYMLVGIMEKKWGGVVRGRSDERTFLFALLSQIKINPDVF